MKADSRSVGPAQVEVLKARLVKETSLGIEFSNEIDVWSQMEFHFRRQIGKMQREGVRDLEKTPQQDELKPLRYALRELII